MEFLLDVGVVHEVVDSIFVLAGRVGDLALAFIAFSVNVDGRGIRRVEDFVEGFPLCFADGVGGVVHHTRTLENVPVVIIQEGMVIEVLVVVIGRHQVLTNPTLLVQRARISQQNT